MNEKKQQMINNWNGKGTRIINLTLWTQADKEKIEPRLNVRKLSHIEMNIRGIFIKNVKFEMHKELKTLMNIINFI